MKKFLFTTNSLLGVCLFLLAHVAISQENCYSVMHERDLTCDVGQMRGEWDYHMPWGSDWDRSDDELKAECCQQNCYSVMNRKSLTCDSGLYNRGPQDYHQPSGSGGWDQPDEKIKDECCTDELHSYRLPSSESKCISCPPDYNPDRSPESFGYKDSRICNTCDEEINEDAWMMGFHDMWHAEKCKHSMVSYLTYLYTSSLDTSILHYSLNIFL